MPSGTMSDWWKERKNIPNTLEMHRPNLDHVPRLLALENTIATTARHSSDVQELGAVNHVVVFTPSHTHAIRLDLEAQAAFIFPESSGDSRLHAVRRDLTRLIKVSAILGAGRGWRRRRRAIGRHGGQRQGLGHHRAGHGRSHGVPVLHGSHGVRILRGVGRSIAVGSRLDGMTVVGVLRHARRRPRALRMRLIDLHVGLTLIHAPVAMRGVMIGRGVMEVTFGPCDDLLLVAVGGVGGVGFVGTICDGARQRLCAGRRGAGEQVGGVVGAMGSGVVLEHSLLPLTDAVSGAVLQR